MDDSYAVDFNVWVQQTAQLLRERRWQDLDVEHLIEEIEDLGKSERRGICSSGTTNRSGARRAGSIPSRRPGRKLTWPCRTVRV